MANKNTSGNLGFEEKLWLAADKMRNNMDPAEYKHVVLGLVFLKYISDSFEELYQKLKHNPEADPEDKDEYIANNVFWVPQNARWQYLRNNAKKPEIGMLVDDALIHIEKENPSLRGVLPKIYARSDLDKVKLGELIDLIGKITLIDTANKTKDLLGRVYEYFIGRFASAEGKGGGEFYTPEGVVKLLVNMIEPFHGRVYDPCCGSGGMFVQSEKFIESHGGRKDDIAIYGQEMNPTSWRLCKMNLAIRGINGNIGPNHADSFNNDLHKDLKADFILANPPFNASDWGGERLKDDVRWKYGTPPSSNANYAWIQHFIHHLSPSGTAGFVLANLALSSESNSETQIRQRIINNDLIDCIVSLPDKLFYTTPIPASLWFITRNKNDGKTRDRRNEILFIDGEKLYERVSRTANEISDENIKMISDKYKEWKSINGDYKDEPGFCKSVSIEKVIEGKYSLFPAQYVGFKYKVDKYSKDEIKKIVEKDWNVYETELLDVVKTNELITKLLVIDGSIEIPSPTKYERVKIGDILVPSNEKLGKNDEPDVLTLTEKAGLMLQSERFAKRVATENTSKYKVIRKTDIVYNPYLLWAGAIDQCWIVDIGIVSPAYETFKVKDGYNATIIGKIIKSKLLLEMYNGISIGTVKRRRRAPAEKFLDLEIEIPSLEDQIQFTKYSELLQDELAKLKKVHKSLSRFVGDLSDSWINGTEN